MRSRLQELGRRDYPQTWYLIDVVSRNPRLLGQEVVDLSPGAIELRHVAKEMRLYADEQGRWLPVQDESILDRLGKAHRRILSFGPRLHYCVEHDLSRSIHDGRPFRHLAVQFSSRVLTPATSAEIGLYFYGRRPAAFGFVEAHRVHGFIGFDWEPLDADDIHRLLRREMAES